MTLFDFVRGTAFLLVMHVLHVIKIYLLNKLIQLCTSD